jgi:hypothetical protein
MQEAMRSKGKSDYGLTYGSICDEQSPPLRPVTEEEFPIRNARATRGSGSFSLTLTAAAAGAAFLGLLLLSATVFPSEDHGSQLVSLVRKERGETGRTSEEKEKSYSSTPRFYDEQLVDHFSESNTATYSHRYYAKKKYFKGPGHPIFLEIGGEAANEIGFFYGFIDHVMAEKFGAYVLHPEHRFYGLSQPVDFNAASTAELLQLLTPDQAMADMLQLAQHYRKKLGCSMKKTSKRYCPLITVGGKCTPMTR